MEKIKILVVDDEARMRKLVKDFLVKKNFDVIEAENGEAACDIFFDDQSIGLIILDVMMPKINGYKVCRLLKFDAKYKDIPILMVTARSQDEDKVIGEETGANEYITKPFQVDYVLEKVKSYLG